MGRLGPRLLASVAFLGWLTACGSSHSPAPAPTPVPLPLPLPIVNVQLSGTVKNYEGGPMPGADVSFSYGGPAQDSVTAKADASGHYTMTVTTGSLKDSISASHEGYYSDTRQISVTSDQVQDLQLMGGIAVNAGGQVDAEIHVGPHNSICAAFLEPYNDLQPCRAFIVHLEKAGTVSASLAWSGGSGLALTQTAAIVAGIPGFGPTVCCEPGLVLRISTTGPGHITLLVRLRDAQIAPVRFTLTTSIS